jgi:hypothetical protein
VSGYSSAGSVGNQLRPLPRSFNPHVPIAIKPFARPRGFVVLVGGKFKRSFL